MKSRRKKTFFSTLKIVIAEGLNVIFIEHFATQKPH
jgi:hypothetical protein